MDQIRLDLSGVPGEMVDEIYRQGETCLEGVLHLATAADQRATTLTGVFGAASAALMAAGATLLAGSHPSAPLIWGSGVAATFFLAAAICCAWAARPAAFFVGGYEPRLLAPAATDRTWMLRCAAEDLQQRIHANRQVLERSARLTNIGTMAAFFAAPAALSAFGVAFGLS